MLMVKKKEDRKRGTKAREARAAKIAKKDKGENKGGKAKEHSKLHSKLDGKKSRGSPHNMQKRQSSERAANAQHVSVGVAPFPIESQPAQSAQQTVPTKSTPPLQATMSSTPSSKPAQQQQANAFSQPSSQLTKHERDYRRVKELIMQISAYPVGASFKQREEARKALVHLYKKVDDNIKGSILAYMNEKLSSAREYRDFICLDYLKEKRHSERVNPAEITAKILDFSSSVEGAAYFLELLAAFDDELATKLLTFHITRYLSQPFLSFRGLAIKGIALLGKMKTKHAFHTLLYYKELIKGVDIEAEVEKSLSAWGQKIVKGKVKLLDEEEKLAQEILERAKKPKKVGEYAQYR